MQDIREEILLFMEEGRQKEAEALAAGSREATEFFEAQKLLNATLPELRVPLTPDSLLRKIEFRLIEETLKAEEEPTFAEKLRLWLRPMASLSLPLFLVGAGVLLILLKSNQSLVNYYAYKVKSHVVYLLDRASSAKDILVFFFDKNSDKVSETIIKKDKNVKKEEEKRWQVKSDKNPRVLLCSFPSYRA